MSRDVDPYLYPGTTILRNKAEIRDAKALALFEYEETKWRSDNLREKPIKGKFDLKHLQAIHGYLFQEIYDWAGQIRTVNISKGGDGFCAVAFIERYASQLAKDIARENYLQGLEPAAFVARFTHYYAEWNALHPFREGNGRSTREFFAQLAQEAGYVFDQCKIDNDRDRWNQASKRSFSGDLEPLQQIFTNAIVGQVSEA